MVLEADNHAEPCSRCRETLENRLVGVRIRHCLELAVITRACVLIGWCARLHLSGSSCLSRRVDSPGLVHELTRARRGRLFVCGYQRAWLAPPLPSLIFVLYARPDVASVVPARRKGRSRSIQAVYEARLLAPLETAQRGRVLCAQLGICYCIVFSFQGQAASILAPSRPLADADERFRRLAHCLKVGTHMLAHTSRARMAPSQRTLSLRMAGSSVLRSPQVGDTRTRRE